MSLLLTLKTSTRTRSAALLRSSKGLRSTLDRGDGFHLYSSKVKPLPKTQVRCIGEAKLVSGDLRKKYFKDLIITIGELHKAKLSEHSTKKPLEVHIKRPDASLSLHSFKPTRGEITSLPRQSWTTSVQSFSRQLFKYNPKASVQSVQEKQVSSNGSQNMKSSVRVNNGFSSSMAVASSSKEKIANNRKLPLNTSTEKTAKDLVCEQNLSVNDHNFSSIIGSSDFDIITNEDMIVLDSEISDSLPVFDEVNSLENGPGFRYDNESHLTESKFSNQVVEDRKVSKKRTRRKRSEIMLQTNDLELPDVNKDFLDRIGTLLKNSKKSLIEHARDVSTQAKEATYLVEVSSYIDLCINTNMLKSAQALLTTGYLRGQQAKTTRGLRPVRDISIYSKLMRAWAKQGNLEAIRKLFLQVEGLKLKPSFESYAICLECLGRQTIFSHDVIKVVIQDIENAGFQLENIFKECNFVEEDKLFILKAIHAVQPEFSPVVLPISMDYECPLLLDLNANKNKSTNPFHNVLSYDQLVKQSVKQIESEMMDQVAIDSIEPSPVLTASILAARLRLGEQKERWKAAMKAAFITSRQHLQAHSIKESGTSLLPYLKLWNADVYVDLMMQEIDVLGQHMEQYSPTCTILNLRLGEKIFRKFVLQTRIRNKYIESFQVLYQKYLQKYNEEQLTQNHRQMWMEIMSELKMDNFMQNDFEVWPSSVTKALGKFLYNIMMSEVKIDSLPKKTSEDSNQAESRTKTEIPAFFTVFRMRDGNQAEEIMPHPFLVRLYTEANLRQLNFEPHELPCLVPPIPWFAANKGGNLLSTTDLIRNLQFSVKQYKAIVKLSLQSLYPMFDGLNAVSACSWRTNKKVLDVVIEVFSKGGDTKLGIPEKVDINAELPKMTLEMTSEDRILLFKNNQRMIKEHKEMYSQWCTELYRLSIAQKYRDEVFWFPHSMDFRGRVYPTPPHFNHLGNDVGRSIMLFGKGKPLGAGGLDWLKIHLVNLTGFKKRRSNKERLEYANEMMTEILDSADNPLTGHLWWQTADEPWQTLACCIEIANAIRSPDPEKYISHIPVHQDGSCNGLQHYAALGRDESGANSVNLNPFDAPQDVYSDVVELVEKQRQKEAAEGNLMAKQLEGFVQRKVIKQTIMTTVYGVTRYGAGLQIGGQLRHMKEFPEELLQQASMYLTNKTFESLQTMFTSTKKIQDWFVLCADIISRLQQQPVEWITPLGWPIVQPYCKSHKVSDKKFGTASYEKPVPFKQRNAFPPNFIHSLDSAHMMLTAIHCLRSGILFASVHDCFWTHACDVPTMNKICREQFVGLHSEPILEDLAKFFMNRFGYSHENISNEKCDKQQAMRCVNKILQNVPARGTFDIRKVMESTYFFS